MLMSQKILLNILNACIQIKAVGGTALPPRKARSKKPTQNGVQIIMARFLLCNFEKL